MVQLAIITALYNHEKFIGETIESVLAQNDLRVQHIIWDDGSSDQSLAIALDYQRRYPERIQVCWHEHHQNLGQEKTRNAALAQAQSTWVQLLDSDDRLMPNAAAALLNRHYSPTVGWVFGRTLVLKPNQQLVDSGMPLVRSDFFNQLLTDNFIGAGACMVRRSALAKLQLKFAERFQTMGEYPVWLALAYYYSGHFVDDYIYAWRQHGNNLGTQKRLQAKAELVNFLSELLKNQTYSDCQGAIAQALQKKKYDWANELILEEQFDLAQEACQTILNNEFTSPAVWLKAQVLYLVLALPVVSRNFLLKQKHQQWRKKAPLLID